MENKRLYRIALSLAIITIIYNAIEGLFSLYFGFENESLSLFGFGVDSYIEVISGVGIAHMILRIRKYSDNKKDRFEKTALKITGYSFYILSAGLILSSIYNIYTEHYPLTTFWGFVISIISIIIMLALVISKTKVGKLLKSEAILADAECSKVCIYMSLILLFASGSYELFKIPYIDSIGAIGIVYFSLKEGRECFEKAKSDKYCSFNG